MVVDKKARAFVKITKTWQFRQPEQSRAFTGKKHALAHAFYVKYDQNYGLRGTVASLYFDTGYVRRHVTDWLPDFCALCIDHLQVITTA